MVNYHLLSQANSINLELGKNGDQSKIEPQELSNCNQSMQCSICSLPPNRCWTCLLLYCYKQKAATNRCELALFIYSLGIDSCKYEWHKVWQCVKVHLIICFSVVVWLAISLLYNIYSSMHYEVCSILTLLLR